MSRLRLGDDRGYFVNNFVVVVVVFVQIFLHSFEDGVWFVVVTVMRSYSTVGLSFPTLRSSFAAVCHTYTIVEQTG